MAGESESLLERLVAFPTIAGHSNLELVEWLSGFLDDRSRGL
jgi:hypothetical protein